MPSIAALEPAITEASLAPLPLRVVQLSLIEALQDLSLRQQWEKMHEQSDDAHPLLHPDAVEAWFGQDSGEKSSSPFVHALMQGTELLSLGVLDSWTLPIVGRLKWKRSGRRLYSKSLLSRDSKAAVSWLRSLANASNRYVVDSLYVEALDRKSSLCSFLKGAGREMRWLEPGSPQPRWRIQLPTSIEEYWTQQFSSKTRNTLRRKKKRLADYTVKVVTTPDEMAEFLSAASDVSRESWQSRTLGLRVQNSERELRLFSDLASRGEFRGYLMSFESRFVAFAIVTNHNGTASYEETGYLPESSDLSPGQILVSELVDDIISTGQCILFDFGLGHASYKESFSNHQSLSEDVWLLRRGLRTSIDFATIHFLRMLRSATKTVLAHVGLLHVLKRWSRRR